MAVELGKTISLRDLLQIFFRRKKTLLGVFAVVLGVGAAYTFTQPRIYDATSRVLIKKGTEAVVPNSKALQASSAEIQSEMEIIKSSLIIEDAVKLLQDPEKKQSSAAALSHAINEFKAAIEVAPVKSTGFVEVHFNSESPGYSAKAVNVLVDVYIGKRGEIFQIGGALDFMRDQTAEADERLLQSQEQLQAYQREKDAYLLAEQKASLVSVMASFEMLLQNTDLEIADMRQQIGGFQKALTPESEGLYLGSQSDATVDAIKGQIAQLEMERNKLLQTYRPDSKKIQSMDAELAMTRRSLTEGQRGAADAQLQQAQIGLSSLMAKRASLAARISEAKEQIRQLEEKSYEYTRLNELVESNRASYQTYMQKEEQARMSSTMDQSKTLDVSVAEYASIPEAPVSPRVQLNMLVALIVGVIAAFGVAVTREFLDSSLNDPDDVMRELELPTLVSLPDFGSRRIPRLSRGGARS